ncbi:phosphotransferase [Pseudahrensia aquimaris]|uniref:Phosphotransferase n=1 Tax=Pseudahrensia aquimaris TaxID=744461 RepID=A0ABW3FB68_9HYPH
MLEERKQVKTASSMIGADRGRLVAEVSMKVFGQAPKRVAFPGGRSRNTFLIDLGDESWILSQRETSEAAALEAVALQYLARTGHTPKFKAICGRWTVQEYVPGTRLPIALDASLSMAERVEMVGEALEALLRIQHIGRCGPLFDKAPVIGADLDWFVQSARGARMLSKQLGVKPPNVNEHAIGEALCGPRNDFIKFDARPGNALRDGHRTVWFDWEDCGRGNALEDLVFVLCDEWMMLDERAETQLIDTYLSAFAPKLSTGAATRQFVLYGTVHMCERVRRCIHMNVRQQGWCDRNTSLAGDGTGNTPAEIARLCDRLSRWADRTPQTRGYVDWIKDISSFFELQTGKQTHAASLAA